MASITMTASFTGGMKVSGQPSVNRRRVVVAKASSQAAPEETNNKKNQSESNNTRRDMIFAAAAAAICAVGGGQGMAIAAEPKRGTPEARKIFAPVCVTMPTARICNK